MKKYDTMLSLEQLENYDWRESKYDSSLVNSCHKLRKIPINMLTAGDIRLLIGQNMGLKYLIPIALKLLAENPMVRTTYYYGDLLKNVLSIPKCFWEEEQDLYYELSEIIIEVDEIYDSIINHILFLWEELSPMTFEQSENENDKEKLIRKYGLKLENGAWYSMKENSHKHLIFKEFFVQRQDIIGLLFRINKLCSAKVKYFRQHMDEYEPCKYNYKDGFVIVELWDSEFLKHKVSGYILDYRFLQSITVYSDFLKLCGELERYNGCEKTELLNPISHNILVK